ncbi:MAG: MFS transporter [Pseudomonadota bacterium]|nr:MFS transporter [Pseudomonadota bacterium]
MKQALPQRKVFLFFFLYSFSFGAIFPRIGDLQLQMGIGEGALGLALVGLPLGVQLALFFADNILAFLGFRFAICIGVPTLGISLISASLAQEPFGFFFSLIIGGIAVGIVEVAVNLEADRVEYHIDKRIMNRSHSFCSLCFFTAGLFGALFSQVQISPTVHFAISFFVGSLLALYFSFRYRAAKLRPNPNDKTSTFVVPNKGVLALVIFTLSAMLIEGAGIDWSVIFMRDIFGTPAFVNGTALFLGAFAQFLVRYFADSIVERYGSETVARVSIVAMFLGLCIISLTNEPYVALLGFSLMGGGTAVLFPLAMSAAAQKSERSAATNVASLAQLSFVVFLVGPPLLGFVAENFGIRTSFAICLPLLFLSWIFVFSLKQKV